MTLKNVVALVVAGSFLTLPLSGQTYSDHEHERAKAEQKASDHRHHTTAKVVGGSTAAGAVIGGLAGGGKGALIGGAVGAGGGVVANKARANHDVKKRERRDSEYRSDHGPR
jgi:outer membrane lipoprotein SlyB